MGLVDAIYQYSNQQDEDYFDKRKERLERLKDLELAQAGDSAIKRQIIEEKYFKQQQKLEEEKAKREEQAKEKAKRWRIAMATADAFAAGSSIFAQQAGGLITKTGAAAAGISIAMGYATQVIGALSNARHCDIVSGLGNGTSDSNLYMLSKGERILSTGDVDRLGGHQMIDRAIDRGTTYNNTSSLSLTLINPIGNEEYIRDNVIPAVTKELSR